MASEPSRRWFYCNEVDLVIFEDTNGFCGFQLAYDKHINEHSFIWTREKGYKHYVVDDGEPLPGVNNTPVLYANGAFDRNKVLAQFLELAVDMPPSIVSFVREKLLAFNGNSPA